MKRILLYLLALLLLPLATGCAVSEKEELQLGLDSHGQFEQQGGGAYPDQQIQGYVNSIGLNMARYAGRPDMKWQFQVLNANDINAFAVPGGYIYITQNLLFRMQNEAQLAGVLGHEAGHIANRHTAKQIETQRGFAVATAGISAAAEYAGYAAAGDLSNVASQLYLLKYSRAHETEADYSGLKYMTEAGYNPNGMVQVMQILKAASGSSGGGKLSQWTSTHPDPGNRIEYLTQAIKEKYASAAQTGRYGEPEFKAAVLSRRRAALPAIDLTQPVTWCAECRATALASAKLAGTELLHEAK